MKNTDTIEFAVSAANEKESQTMLQLVRPKEGDMVEFPDGKVSYRYDGSLILYLSDIHLENIIKAHYCKTIDDVSTVIEKIINGLKTSYYEYWAPNGGTVVVLAGDVCHSVQLYEMFIEKLRCCFFNNVIVLLGNHELWPYAGLDTDAIVKKYKDMTSAVAQNEIILFEDEIINENYSRSYSWYLQRRISYEKAMRLSIEELTREMQSARVIMLTGTGFSGCNQEFNANNGIYQCVLSREQEICESQKFEELYDRFILASKAVSDRVIVVATHMPIQDWHHNPVHENGIIYISGHTHRNFFHDDGIQRIYADNQNGYLGRHPVFKCVYLDDVYDPFVSYADGIYDISKQDYILFYRAKKMRLVMKRNYQALYILRPGYN